MSEAIHRVNHEIRQRRLNVLRVTDLTPRMRRVTLGGPELQGFISLGTDDHIKLLFAETAEQQQAIDARALGREGGERPIMREYTPPAHRLAGQRTGHRLRAARRWPCFDLGRAGRARANPGYRRAARLDGGPGHLRCLPADRR